MGAPGAGLSEGPRAQTVRFCPGRSPTSSAPSSAPPGVGREGGGDAGSARLDVHRCPGPTDQRTPLALLTQLMGHSEWYTWKKYSQG